MRRGFFGLAVALAGSAASTLAFVSSVSGLRRFFSFSHAAWPSGAAAKPRARNIIVCFFMITNEAAAG